MEGVVEEVAVVEEEVVVVRAAAGEEVLAQAHHDHLFLLALEQTLGDEHKLGRMEMVEHLCRRYRLAKCLLVELKAEGRGMTFMVPGMCFQEFWVFAIM